MIAETEVQTVQAEQTESGGEVSRTYSGLTATYSPEDNKLRLYSLTRLPKSVFDRVKAAGFKWAPRQELFVAPMWTPEREDLLLELCGEIGDEDTSLVDRAEERAERFEEYSEKREADAHRVKSSVDQLADGIPFGQPILVGHHSERRARKDAEKIRNGMKKAVKLWETSKYWEDRAAGAIWHAKYKELPAVRHRRIKTLESELRGIVSRYTPQEPPHYSTQTDADGNPHQYVWCGSKNYRGGSWVRVDRLEAIKKSCSRWVSHLENRIAYEKAMLGESGGIKADRFNLEIGGKILTHGLWLTITKITKKNGAILSVSTNNRSYPRVVPVERISDYQAPAVGVAEKVKAATKLPPLVNYPGEGFVHITQEVWNKRHRDYKGTRTIPETATVGRHRVRIGMFRSGYSSEPVYITNAKRVDPPTVEKDIASIERQAQRMESFREKIANPSEFEPSK